jgi:hypothetical protein
VNNPDADISALRKALGALLVVDADFDAFCIDHYNHIYRRFGTNMDRVAKENLLLTLVPADNLMQTLRTVDPKLVLPLAAGAASSDGTPAAATSTTSSVQPPRAPYDRRFYVVRPEEESQSLDALDYHKPVVFFGPELCGKTWLLHTLTNEARQRGAQVVSINLNIIDKSARSTFATFLHTFALRIFRELKLDIEEVNRSFAQNRGGPVAVLNDLMSWSVLDSINNRLVLSIDNVDLISEYPYQDEFFGMLRAWVDSSGFEKLHLVLAISTAPALLVQDIHRSPFNLGDVLTVPDFSLAQIEKLAQMHNINADDSEIMRLSNLVGGHPYLTRLAFYESYRRKMRLGALLDRVDAEPQGGSLLRIWST